jgi:hypothetical protein
MEDDEEPVSEDSSDVLLDPPSNDTNEVDLIYFACMTKHYLRLVNSSSPRQNRHQNHLLLLQMSLL